MREGTEEVVVAAMVGGVRPTINLQLYVVATAKVYVTEVVIDICPPPPGPV